jgi:hypothetical protein
MAPRLMIRCALWGLCLAIALLGARSAHAAAPICDETASSRIAPPPVLPIRDVKLEAAVPCQSAPTSAAPVAVVPVGLYTPVNPAVSSDATATEAWLRSVPLRLVAPMGDRTRLAPALVLGCKPGFSPSVFRPPRCW